MSEDKYQFKGTPAPWTKTDGCLMEVNGRTFYDVFRIYTDYARPAGSQYNIVVADVRNPFYNDPKLNPLTIDEAKANAQLIATAPALLSVLIKAVKDEEQTAGCRPHGLFPIWYYDAKAAIEQALNTQP